MEIGPATRLVQHLAEALGIRHALGIVHRDIKPHNVMIDERGEPLLMELGLASRNRREADAKGPSWTRRNILPPSNIAAHRVVPATTTASGQPC
jgi:serine/threonine protein kinase